MKKEPTFIVSLDEQYRHRARRILEGIPSLKIITSGLKDQSMSRWCFYLRGKHDLKSIYSTVSAGDIPSVHVYSMNEEEVEALDDMLLESSVA